MGRKLAHHLVLGAVVLTLAVESFSRASQEHGDYPAQHHLRRQHQHQQQHQQQNQHHRHRGELARTRNQTSAGYSLISGPGNGNSWTDYRPPVTQLHQHHHRTVPQQHWPQQHHGVHRETPPQHRRHRAQAHPQQPEQPEVWRRTSNTGTASTGSAGRPVTRMLTRSGTSSFGSTRHGNTTSRNVCIVYIYRKSVIKTHHHAPCTDPANCQGLRTYSAPVAKREVCCRGWDTTTTVSDGCFKPICLTPCRNGGQCNAPDQCSCPAGFTGKYCEQDVNECKEHKPCDQTCYNTEGSYYCTCRDGFMLQSDRQSCKRIDEANDLATEARDMENDLDVDYDSLDIRLKKLEQMMSSRDDRQELNKKVQYTMDAVSVLKSQVARLTQRLYPSDYGNRVH
ncbi:uncharacterized protein LOC128722969 isoform X1 [Anopheles nili]|uniref:uncharacterized protein LOC128722969 isoform X1 n=1 Tax=Anopheles nili TaxID=185578 RepID=UPI00237AB692|nr:uncharacterized protein LOC128722969 isoform X1 [Anopheles nili]